MAGMFEKKTDGTSDKTPKPQKNVKSRWMIVLGGGVAVMLIFSTMMNSEQTQTTQVKKDKVVNLNPGTLDEKSWQTKSMQMLQELQNKSNEQSAENKALRAKLEKLEAAKNAPAPTAAKAPEGVVPPPVFNASGAATKLDTSKLPPSPPQPPKDLMASVQKPVDVKPVAASGTTDGAPSTIKEDDATMIGMYAAPVKKSSTATASAAAAEKAPAKSEYVKNKYAGMLPAGSSMKVTLNYGISAGTSQSTQSNPMPIVMTITDLAFLPGDLRYDLRTCFILATGYGDLSAERVYFRTSTLSCMNKQNKLVLNASLPGGLVDHDSVLGLRGIVEDRQGAKLAKATIAGFAQGLTSALSSAQSSVTSSALGSVSTISGGDALKQSGLSGASKAVDQLAQFYLKEAQSIFPVITIEGGRTATLFTNTAVNLEWGSYDGKYTKEVKPDNK